LLKLTFELPQLESHLWESAKRPSGKSVGNADDQPTTFSAAWEQRRVASEPFWQQMDALVDTLDGLADQESPT
jgi:hypothetical protein